jgi:hypothetical protein
MGARFVDTVPERRHLHLESGRPARIHDRAKPLDEAAGKARDYFADAGPERCVGSDVGGNH